MTMTEPAPPAMEFSHDPQRTGEDVKTLFADEAHAFVIAPFITKPGLLPLIEAMAPAGRLDVVTRWDPREIRAGVSDPMIIDDVEATGGAVRLLPRLHAKVYLARDMALVGSANPTGPGLGFSTSTNIEALVDVPAAAESVRRLLAIVDAVASPADRVLALQMVEYAATLPEPPASAGSSGGPRAEWVPMTMVPSRVLDCYFGNADRDDYRADLKAIDAPPGLSAPAFKVHVALVLQQGLVGRIFKECEGLQQWQGIQHMRAILTGAGIDPGDAPPLLWQRLLNWFEYYLGAASSFNGSYAAQR
jgi:hypothetical protein